MSSRSHILYLQFGPQIDRTFINMSQFFSNFNMTLVPISVNDLKNYLPKNRENLIVVVKDMQTYKQYRGLLKRFLNYSIRNSKMRVFEISSFAIHHDISNLKEEKLISMQLPMTMMDVARKIIPKVVTEDDIDMNRWPGGKRAKLPSS